MKKRVTGERQADNNYFTQVNPVDINGNKLPQGAAMVAACVAHYRRGMRPLKTIWCRKEVWKDFEFWARTCMTEMEADSEVINFTFDGVFIRPGSDFQKDDLTWEFYPIAEA